MRGLFLFVVFLWATWDLAQGVDKKTTPQVKNVVIEEGVVTPVYLRPGYATSVRLPEEVNSVVVGNPLAFKAEDSEAEPRLVFIKPITTKAAESNALITTKSNQEINLHLISSGLAGASSEVDFLVEFKAGSTLAPLEQFFGLAKALEDLLGRPVDLVEPSAIRNPFIRAGIYRSREVLYGA